MLFFQTIPSDFSHVQLWFPKLEMMFFGLVPRQILFLWMCLFSEPTQKGLAPFLVAITSCANKACYTTDIPAIWEKSTSCLV